MSGEQFTAGSFNYNNYMLVHVILFWLFLSTSVCLGAAFSFGAAKCIGQERILTTSVALNGMFGLFLLGMIGVGANYLLPLSAPVIYPVIAGAVVCGAAVLMMVRQDLSPLECALLFLTAALLAPLAGSLGPGYDGPLYHLPHQLWLRSEPMVLGLANLHGRFGFSSLYEYTGALLWLDGQLLLLSYLQVSFVVFFLLFLVNQSKDSAWVPLVLVLGVTVNVALYDDYLMGDLAYTYTDLPAGVMFAASFIFGYGLLYREEPTGRRDWSIFAVLLLAAVFLKLSAILLCAWFAFVLMYRIFVVKDEIREPAVGLSLHVVLLLIWLGKNIATTGCLLYPEASTCFTALPWSAQANALGDADAVTGWARLPGPGYLTALTDPSWFTVWWLPTYREFLTDLTRSGVIVGILYCVVAMVAGSFRASLLDLRYWGALSAVLLALLLWFWKAPTPRFGIGVFMVLFPVLFSFIQGKNAPQNARFSWWVRSAVVLAVLMIAFQVGEPIGKISRENILTMRRMTVANPKVVPDPVYGVRPVDTDQCALVPECAPYDRPPRSIVWGRTVFYRN